MLEKARDNFDRVKNIHGIIYTTPEPPDNIKDIANWELPKEQQRFRPVNLAAFEKMTPIMKESFIEKQWNYRRNGYWFFNNGNLEYLTGSNWFFLNNWKMPIESGGFKKLGLPMFIDDHRDVFYAWQACVEDPSSYGLLFITKRRHGKTEIANSIIYNDISQTPEAIGGIQSKSNNDAKTVFNKLIKGWQTMPSFFKPIDTGESHPATALRFYEPSKRDTKNQHKDYGVALRSEINFENAKEEAYDGNALFRYLGDEIGKTTESNVYNRWYIVKECLADGSSITGKAFLTTTVEEMEKKGGANCKLLWDDSDQLNKNQLNQTKSGLYRIFTPAYSGLRGNDEKGIPFIDEYGYTDQERAKNWLLKKREGLKGEALNSEKRKYPFTIDEAFRMDVKFSFFDLDKIYEQKEYNSAMLVPVWRKGNFVWKDGVRDSEVIFHESENGRWLVSWHPRPEDRNRQTVAGGQRRPVRDILVAGCDPFDHKTTTDYRKSNAASHVFLKYNPMDPHNSNCFVSQYLNRPPKPEMFYEDMIMQCHYFGGMMLVENNKPGIINYFRQRGYVGYLMARPEATHTDSSRKQTEIGIPLSGEAARSSLIEALTSYIHDYIGRNTETGQMGNCPFNELLDDWIKFEFDDWTKYDSTVSSGLAILGSKKTTLKLQSFDISELFQTYDNSGKVSKRIK